MPEDVLVLDVTLDDENFCEECDGPCVEDRDEYYIPAPDRPRPSLTTERLRDELRRAAFTARIAPAPVDPWLNGEAIPESLNPLPPRAERRQPDNREYRFYSPDDPGYVQHLRQSFQFFRRNAGNRYSPSTLMRLANAADDIENSDTPPRRRNWPVLTVATSPQSFDEETEVKTGGMAGMMVTFPDGKALFAVISSLRRKGIGSNIFRYNSDYSGILPYFWVAVSNVPGQMFLLSQGLVATALNSAGAIRYGYNGAEE